MGKFSRSVRSAQAAFLDSLLWSVTESLAKVEIPLERGKRLELSFDPEYLSVEPLPILRFP